MITIVDYGLGNLASIKNMFKKIGENSIISADTACIEKATKLVLPGVGNFKEGMKNITESGFLDILNKKVINENIPVLGICLGMQLMTQNSEEGDVEGLGWVNAKTFKFNFKNDLNIKIPHFGWNEVLTKGMNGLFSGFTTIPRFYFVHSYYVKCNESDLETGITEYGIEFTSAFKKGNIYGVQFHPEKSHKYGMQLLKNFAEI